MPPTLRRAPDAGYTFLIAIASLVAFGGSLFSGFHLDDYGMLQDRAITSPSGWMQCWNFLQTRPLTWFSFWLNYRIAGRDPLLWHAVNILLHAGCSVVLYRMLRRFWPGTAVLAALVFAVHPIQAESVDYVYSRAILIATLFSLLAIDAWLRDREWLAAVWFGIALLGKEECAAIPLVLALFSWIHGQLRSRFLAISVMLACSAAAAFRVIAAIHLTGMKNIGMNAGFTPLEYFSTQGIAILRYFGLVAIPWAFTVDPQLTNPGWLGQTMAWALIGLLAAAAVLRLRDVKAAFWIVAVLVLLIPSSSVFPVADLAADRRMYLPMAAAAPAIALLIPRLKLRWKGAIVVGALAFISLVRTSIWASDERLWTEAVRLAPDKVRPKIQLARALPPDQALAILEEARFLAPNDPQPETEMARVNLELNRPGEALGHVGKALALAPNDPHALSNRGVVLLAMKQASAARQDFLTALSIDPCLVEARENLEHSGGVPTEIPSCPASLPIH